MAHGIIIDKPPRLGLWERFPTETHPRKRNGAVKWMGDYGFVQDHAIHTEVLFWRAETPIKVDPKVVRAAISQADEERKRLQENAAMRASMIINRCVLGRHEYLARKGFPDERALIWFHDKLEHLVIPMRDGNNELVGMQTIDAEGNKKFLYGQKTSGANFVIGQQGTNVLCEGFATGLSIREAFRHLKMLARIHVCFSANNLVTISKRLQPGLVVADNDESGTGEKVARQTGWKFWMSEKKGEDFNDTHKRTGLFQAAQSLWRSLYPNRGRQSGSAQSFGDAILARKSLDQGHASIKDE